MSDSAEVYMLRQQLAEIRVLVVELRKERDALWSRVAELEANGPERLVLGNLCSGLRAEGAAAERAAVVAWLRSQDLPPSNAWYGCAEELADGIESAYHLKEPTDG